MSTEQQRKLVEVSADIAAPPETVWRLVSDLDEAGMRTTLERLKTAAEAQGR